MTDATHLEPYRVLSPDIVLASTIFGEAEGEPRIGQWAVGQVIYNRYLSGKHGTLTDTCLAPWQFSCWWGAGWGARKEAIDEVVAMRAPDIIYTIAHRLMVAVVPDLLEGATHYINPALVAPDWVHSMHFVCRVGHHEFYRQP